MTARMTTRPDWTALNAYVDGELPPAEAARVAKALADDRSLARAAATLAQLKAAVHESCPEPEIEVSAVRPRRAAPRAALAACLVGLLALGVAALWMPFGDEAAPPPWLDTAWSAHTVWAEGSALSASTGPGAGQVLAAFSRLGPKAYLPDLTAAKLTLGRVAPALLAGPELEVLHLGYTGTRGCRVSLFILAGGGDLPQVFSQFGDGPRQSYAWRSASHGYLLMADGMDRSRLNLIARTLHEATRVHTPLGPEARTALSASREASPPCAS